MFFHGQAGLITLRGISIYGSATHLFELHAYGGGRAEQAEQEAIHVPSTPRRTNTRNAAGCRSPFVALCVGSTRHQCLIVGTWP